MNKGFIQENAHHLPSDSTQSKDESISPNLNISVKKVHLFDQSRFQRKPSNRYLFSFLTIIKIDSNLIKK